jgi:uncharacterized protein (DUF362 family)
MNRHVCPGKTRTASETHFSRRQFLKTMHAAAAGMVLGSPFDRSAVAGTLDGPSMVAVAEATHYGAHFMRDVLELLVASIGGLDDIISPGDNVGIKINLTAGLKWDNHAYFEGRTLGETIWTHPDVLWAMCALIADMGANITILEAIYDDAWTDYTATGYYPVGEHFGANFVNLNLPAPYADFVTRPVGPGALIDTEFVQNGILDDIDCLISLAKAKQHNAAGVTHGIKNLFGLLPLIDIYTAGTGHRAALHRNTTAYDGDAQSNICRSTLDIHSASPIQLVVADAIRTVLGGQTPGVPLTVADFDTLVVSKDPVAADAVVTQAMGLDPEGADNTSPTFPASINYLALGNALGMGNHQVSDPTKIQVLATGMLPVSLVALEAVREDRDIVVTWTTLVEQQVHGFEVQHRADSSHTWRAVGFSRSQGSDQQGHCYRFRFPEPAPGTHYFRLRQLRLDGNSAYSREIEISFHVDRHFVVEPAYPNPFFSTTQFSVEVPSDQVIHVAIFDAMGRLVKDDQAYHMSAHRKQIVRVDGAGLSAGRYHIRINGKSFTSGLTVVRAL